MKIKNICILSVLCIFLSGCQFSAKEPLFIAKIPTQTAQLAPQQPQPSQTPTQSPTPTLQPVQLEAVIWQADPVVPVLMYHRFIPADKKAPNIYTTPLDVFADHLQQLYAADFYLVALEDWLTGNITLPAGKRPLIITLDDLYYGDQLLLDDSGTPSTASGIGVLWDFYQQHPDFGFHASLFYNFGDKYYANQFVDGEYRVDAGYETDLAKAIAWGIENGAVPYNHFYAHPFLNKLNPDEILAALQQNDAALREALSRINREDLFSQLSNLIALPYVIWPADEAGVRVLTDYISPEGKPTLGVVEADYLDSVRLLPAPFSTHYNRWHIPRILAADETIEMLLARLDEIPTAQQHCKLPALPAELAHDAAAIGALIVDAVKHGQCPAGIYAVNGLFFSIDAASFAIIPLPQNETQP